ncbi:methyltransferase family protein [Reinekea marinisedimentorum]|uniref:Protein-S-isoprenylcysteine O-methyltransferase Ste14 n=1 Tax=Reinekea marinisedimentorum TaxID=230495 RepID=A0A4R3ICD3_9GAMM|nr:isoprenylcysteine carboxylmethyltransferase family protein [Reinekea marinisedimentorum]TCS43285.1 protein-S-isoprenylcysteine O-methyltransferase Ste14 [Reinekea marinisedimentorum]
MSLNVQRYKRKVFLIPPVYFVIAIGFAFGCYWQLPQLNLLTGTTSDVVGIAALAVGCYLMLFSVLHLYREKTTFHFDRSSSVVSSGHYRFSRNPIYLGKLIFLLGLSVILGNVLAFGSAVFYFAVINQMFLPYEEEKMEIELGAPYLEYKAKVRRWL